MRSVFASVIDFTVDEHGAQLVSLTKGDTEYICAGSPFWNYSTPTLFPIVGRLKGDSYTFDGKSYTLGQHGFARNRRFSCIDDQPLTFRLAYDYDTLKVYPFKFALTVSYRPLNNELLVTMRVQNLDEVDIWFSLGAHPALKVPFDGGQFSDYVLEFNRDEKLERIPLTNDGLLSRERVPFFEGRRLPLSYDLFDNDALIFDHLNSNCLTLRRDKHCVTLRADAPFWGIWTKRNAPFICLEPWHGHADYADFNGDFTQKPGILSLEPGKSFSAQYSIIIDA